jgi:hypothetical protein
MMPFCGTFVLSPRGDLLYYTQAEDPEETLDLFLSQVDGIKWDDYVAKGFSLAYVGHEDLTDEHKGYVCTKTYKEVLGDR